MDDNARADRILEEIGDRPHVQKVVYEARIFSELRSQPGWQRLYQMVKAKKERWLLATARKFMGPEKQWPTPTEIAYWKGYYTGAWWIIAHPEQAERNLEETAARAWSMTLEEEEE